MNEHHYQRIDKGLPRRKGAQEQQPVSATGTFLSQYTPEQRQAAIADALVALQAGEPTNSIAERHGIPGRTLRSWLIALPEADTARALMIANELSGALEDIEQAKEPMPLARARELFRGWAWIGERRLPAYFGVKAEMQHTLTPELTIMLKALGAPAVPALEGESTVVNSGD